MWQSKNYGNTDITPAEGKYAVFIGRYQPYHRGHIELIEQKLNEGRPCLIMVRDIEPDEKNPFTTHQTINMIGKYHAAKGHKNVKVMSIPDIESVNWGRGVGYEMNEFTPPDNIGWISATGIRNGIKEGSEDWKELVDESIQDDVQLYLSDDYQEPNPKDVHDEWLVEQYNRNRPVEAYASSIKDLPGQQLDLFNDCGDANEY